MMEDHDLLKVSEVAEALRVSKVTVHRLINGGHLDAIRIGRAYRIKRASYLAFLERQAEGAKG